MPYVRKTDDAFILEATVDGLVWEEIGGVTLNEGGFAEARRLLKEYTAVFGEGKVKMSRKRASMKEPVDIERNTKEEKMNSEFSFENDFELVPIILNSRSHQATTPAIFFNKKANMITLNAEIARRCGFKEGDKYNVYKSKAGGCFKFIREDNGILTFRKTPKYDSVFTRSQSLWLNVVPFLGKENLDKLTIICEPGCVMFGVQ